MVSLENFCNWVSMEQEVTENGFHMEDHTSTIILHLVKNGGLIDNNYCVDIKWRYNRKTVILLTLCFIASSTTDI